MTTPEITPEKRVAAAVVDWYAEMTERLAQDQSRQSILARTLQASGRDIDHDPQLNYLSGKVEGVLFAVEALTASLHANELDTSLLTEPAVE